MPGPLGNLRWHIIEGEEGCAFGVQRGLAVVVVDALRASATAAMLLHHGATGIVVVRDVAEARAAKAEDPGALLLGERGGLPPAGFDGGNSPRESGLARGKRVIFTTTNGAQCLVAARGAAAVYFGTTTNASAVARAARGHGAGAVLVPAGLAGAPPGSAVEDWAAAAWIARCAGVDLGEGAEEARGYLGLDAGALGAVFEGAPHAGALRAAGLGEDVAWCARVDVTAAVPRVARYVDAGGGVRAVVAGLGEGR